MGKTKTYVLGFGNEGELWGWDIKGVCVLKGRKEWEKKGNKKGKKSLTSKKWVDE